jgi:hypothetical protein
MLQVWFSCSRFVPSERGVKMIAPLEIYNNDKEHAFVRFFFLVFEGIKRVEIH